MAGQASKAKTWRRRRDPLWRGDGVTLTLPDPAADPSIVRHVLFLGGAGRPTPYHSTTEVQAVAVGFAGRNGRVFETTVPRAEADEVEHIGRIELLGLLQQSGHGKAKWTSPLEVMQARRYVEQWHEHLLSFARTSKKSADEIQALLDALYT